MTTRAPVPATIHQTILNASQMTSRAAMTLNGWTTWEGACQAEVALSRAIDDLRALKPNIRALKLDIRQREAKEREDQRIVARSKRQEVVA